MGLPHHKPLDALSRGILSVIQAAVSSRAAFCLISSSRGGELVHGATGWLSLGGVIEPANDRHVALLVSESEHEGIRESQVELVEPDDRVLSVSFDVQSMRVCAGVARHHAAPPFEQAERGRLHDLVPVCAQLAALHAQCLEHERRELVLHTLRSVTDACCVLDIDTHRVRWVHDVHADQPCARDIFSDEPQFVELVERFHLTSTIDHQLRRAAALGRTTVVRTVDLGRPAEFEGARSLAVALAYGDSASTTLSRREREIAQLLSSGYSTVNAAAILSLSENTIRTYVRRLYRKLEITNRADLTRKCSELALC